MISEKERKGRKRGEPRVREGKKKRLLFYFGGRREKKGRLAILVRQPEGTPFPFVYPFEHILVV